jgi:hypothetical protein
MRSSPGTISQSLIPRNPFDLSSAYSNWLASKNKKPEELSLEEEVKNKYVEDLYKGFQAKEPSYNYSPITKGIGGGFSQEEADKLNKEKELKRLGAFRGYLEKYIPGYGVPSRG